MVESVEMHRWMFIIEGIKIDVGIELRNEIVTKVQLMFCVSRCLDMSVDLSHPDELQDTVLHIAERITKIGKLKEEEHYERTSYSNG